MEAGPAWEDTGLDFTMPAGRALRAGVEPEIVSLRLGHSDVAITLSIYTHVTEADDRRAAEQAAAAIFGP